MLLKNVSCILPLMSCWGEFPRLTDYAVWKMAPASVGTIPLFHEGQYFLVSEAFSQLPPLRKRWSKIKQPPLCHSYLPCGLVPRLLASCSYCSGTTVIGGSKGSGRYLIIEGKDGLFYIGWFISQCIICTGKDSIPSSLVLCSGCILN